jgi:glycerol-3-phosphate cytidylyltransferase-like family protein
MEPTPIVEDEKIIPLSPDQEKTLVTNELAIVSETERNEIAKVVKTEDIVLIDTHKKKLKSFRSRFAAKKFEITEDMVFDKEKYEKALAAWREMKNYRTKTVKPDFDKLKAPYIAITKFYNEKCNPLIEEFKEVENPVGAYVDKMEKLEQAEKDKEKLDLERRTNERVKQLLDAGAAFDSEYYSVESEEFGVKRISLGMNEINSLSDEWFAEVLEKIKAGVTLIAAQQKIKDDAVKLEQENQTKELNLLRENNLKVRARELKMLGFVPTNEGNTNTTADGRFTITAKDVAELPLEEWIARIEDIETKIEAAKKESEKKELISKRSAELLEIGLIKESQGFGSAYNKISIFITHQLVEEINEDGWKEFVIEAKESVSLQKTAKFNDDKIAEEEKALATTREAELAPYWQFVTQEEKSTLGKITEDDYKKLFEGARDLHIQKTNKDAADKTAKENKDKADALAKQGDEAMYNDLVARLKEIIIPAVKTDQFKNKVAIITNFINGLK